MARRVLDRNAIDELTVHDARETIFFSKVAGRLCQWVELDLSWRGWRGQLQVEISARGTRATRDVMVYGRDRITVRCPAPAVWPEPPCTDARLVIRRGERTAEGILIVGSHRPWTVYLLSDLCADDTWAYSDLEAHDRDDYLTTLAELNAGRDNRYNFASAYQVERFRRQAGARDRRRLSDALREGRFYMTPVPNQLLCGAFNLASYPLLLEPYRKHWARAGGMPAGLPLDAYHMEAPTWTNGLANLLACAGFRSFGKSLLQSGAPWIDALRRLPRLTRLEAAPGRYVYLLLRCGDYSEAMPLLPGLPHANGYLHERVIPEHEALGAAYPTSAIPLVGAYSDLCPEARSWVRAKVDVVRSYNAQWWDYPKLVNATWSDFFDHIVAEVGPPERPRRRGLRTVRGDTGAAWEAWLLRIEDEAARFRKAQRDVVSLRTLCAMLGRKDAATRRALDDAAAELVNLGDHAWSGSSPGSKELNLSIRRGRLARLARALAKARSGPARGVELKEGARMALVNTLGWRRACLVVAPEAGRRLALADPETGEEYPFAGSNAPGREGAMTAAVPGVPGFGARVLKLVRAAGSRGRGSSEPVPLALDAMGPVLLDNGREAAPRGGWTADGRGRWQVGPFSVRASVCRSAVVDGTELELSVAGKPPEGSYALRWRFGLPWKRCTWRAESGGGFRTSAPARAGGDLLAGVAGCCIAVGEGLSAAPPGGRSSVDFAFDESGICGLGGPMTELSKGDPGGRLGSAYAPNGVMRRKTTPGVLEWYLLCTDPLAHEAFADQGGARAWRFQCAFRRRAGGFDDVALYRFAAGFCRPGELVSVRAAKPVSEPWLVLDKDDVLVLGAGRTRDGLSIDLYNTARHPVTVRFRGSAVEGRRVALTDMLERAERPCADGSARLGPCAFARLLVR